MKWDQRGLLLGHSRNRRPPVPDPRRGARCARPRVVPTDQPGHGVDRHLLDHGQHESLEEKCEAAALPAPRNLDQFYSVLRSLHPRDSRMKVRFVMEEVQMPPGLLVRVPCLATAAFADRTLERAAGLEADVDVEPLLPRLELRPLHLPGPLQPQGLLKQLGVSRAALRSGSDWRRGVTRPSLDPGVPRRKRPQSPHCAELSSGSFHPGRTARSRT